MECLVQKNCASACETSCKILQETMQDPARCPTRFCKTSHKNTTHPKYNYRSYSYFCCRNTFGQHLSENLLLKQYSGTNVFAVEGSWLMLASGPSFSDHGNSAPGAHAGGLSRALQQQLLIYSCSYT